MRKLLFSLGLLLIFVSFVSALDCQYTTIEKYYEDYEFFYHNGEKIGENLNLSELVKIKQNGLSIKITNNLRVPVSLNISYDMKSPWFGDHSSFYQITIKEQDYWVIEDRSYESCINHPCYLQNLRYYFVEPNLITNEIVSVEKERKICKICPNGKQCLDDGADCHLDIECGYGICNPAQRCGEFNGCPEGKVLKESLCVDSFFTKLKKNIWWILLIPLILGFSWYLFWRGLNEKEQKKIGMKISKLESQLQKKKKEIFKIEKDLKKRQKNKSRIKILNRDLDKLKKDSNKKLEELRGQKRRLKEEKLKPYKNKQGVLVHLNEDGYEVFEDSGKLFHLWWYIKNKGEITSGYQIHHKDGIKINNNIDNLKAMSKRNHNKIHGRYFKKK